MRAIGNDRVQYSTDAERDPPSYSTFFLRVASHADNAINPSPFVRNAVGGVQDTLVHHNHLSCPIASIERDRDTFRMRDRFTPSPSIDEFARGFDDLKFALDPNYAAIRQAVGDFVSAANAKVNLRTGADHIRGSPLFSDVLAASTPRTGNPRWHRCSPDDETELRIRVSQRSAVLDGLARSGKAGKRWSVLIQNIWYCSSYCRASRSGPAASEQRCMRPSIVRSICLAPSGTRKCLETAIRDNSKGL